MTFIIKKSNFNSLPLFKVMLCLRTFVKMVKIVHEKRSCNFINYYIQGFSCNIIEINRLTYHFMKTGGQEYRGQQGGQDQDFRGNMNNR